VGRVLLGDVSREATSRAPCPVAVAARGEPAAPRRIGVGFDGSPESRAALAFAARLAAVHGAGLEVRFAVTPPIAPGTPGYVYLGDVTPGLERRERAAERTLRQALDGLGAPADGRCVEGLPVTELERLSQGVDLLVVGSRGSGPLRRVLLGSTSDAVLHRAHCSVLVVPRPEPEP
jgi:nucleotide-binding universal stress UspA family protein